MSSIHVSSYYIYPIVCWHPYMLNTCLTYTSLHITYIPYIQPYILYTSRIYIRVCYIHPFCTCLHLPSYYIHLIVSRQMTGIYVICWGMLRLQHIIYLPTYDIHPSYTFEHLSTYYMHPIIWARTTRFFAICEEKNSQRC